MVNDVLDLSKVEAGKVELEKKPFDPGALIRRVLTTVRSLAAKKHLHVDTVSLRGPRAAGRRRGADQAGPLQPALQRHQVHRAGEAIGVEARAEGEELRDHRLGRGDRHSRRGPGADLRALRAARRATRGEGTGLGLAIVKSLVELHGGSVSVESEVGDGKQVHRAPPGQAARMRAAPATPRQEKPRSRGSEIPDLSGKTALVVDDSPANRALMERILSAFGCTVLLAGSGEEALAVAGHSSCDLVFMDIQLPGMNGIEAMRRMREAGCAAPMVALTAYAMKGDAERFLAEGFDGFIAKPVRISEVVSFLEGLPPKAEGR